MIEIFLARYGIPLAIAFGLVVAVGAWDHKRIKKAELRGEEKNQVRVVKEATKKNDAAQTARNRITADNSNSVLQRFYRD